MSVSAGGGIDVDVIIKSGPAFVQRLADFQAAATAYKKQVDDLQLGKDALAARDEAQALLATAKQMLDGAKTEAEKIIGAAQAKADEINRGRGRAGRIVGQGREGESGDRMSDVIVQGRARGGDPK
jgi:hypothetical protein